MRRTDRLYDLIQILRDGRLHRAADIGTALGVSTRTVWRDMATLATSGLPVEGERGVGYILRAPMTLPPLMLAAAELDALRAGLRQIAAGEDTTLSRAARSLAEKIAAITPAPVGVADDDIFAPARRRSPRPPSHLPLLRQAIRARERLTVSYIEPSGLESHSDIRPLHLDLKSRVWTLAAWCEQQAGFRRFRLDRLLAVSPTGERFAAEPGRRLSDLRVLEAAASHETRDTQ